MMRRLLLALLVLLGVVTMGSAAARSPALERIGQINARQLPPEARETLRLIDTNGPFPYKRDGITFQNRERRLPGQENGYYREYTVTTPGSKDRGARRIISGGKPPVEFYYTDDHYKTFSLIQR